MSRFQLRSDLTAMENLFEAARVATAVILRSHGFYGLTGEDRDEMFDDVKLATVRHFMQWKVGQRMYCRMAKDGRPLVFLDNVLSSCWSVTQHIADMHIKRIDVKAHTGDIETCLPMLSTQDGFPLYLAYKEAKNQPAYVQLKNPHAKAERVKRMYEDYAAECDELGLTAMTFEAWLVATELNRDADMMWQLLPKDERKEIKSKAFRWRMEIDEKKEKVREYNREWRRRKREREKAARCPPGYEFATMNGVEGIRRKK